MVTGRRARTNPVPPGIRFEKRKELIAIRQDDNGSPAGFTVLPGRLLPMPFAALLKDLPENWILSVSAFARN